MKGLILAGGTGSRLRPLTYTSAKQLIPVANKPILFYALEAVRDAGISDIGIIVGDTRQEVMAAVGDGSRWGVKITYIHQEAPLGLAHAVKTARSFLQRDSFLMFLGDNLVREGVASFVERFRQTRPNALILLSRVEEPQRFGVAELRDGKVVRLVEKPRVPPSDLALVGVYLFDYNIFEAVDNIRPSWRNELEITDAIQYLVDRGLVVEPHMVTGWWKDTGKPEDVLEANRLLLEAIETSIAGELGASTQVHGRAAVGEGTIITGTVIRGPVCIGRDCRIINSYIGPFTSIGDRVTIENSEVEHSVIMEDSSIRDVGVRIDESLIGRGVVIGKAPALPRVYKFIMGDNSRATVS